MVLGILLGLPLALLWQDPPTRYFQWLAAGIALSRDVGDGIQYSCLLAFIPLVWCRLKASNAEQRQVFLSCAVTFLMVDVILYSLGKDLEGWPLKINSLFDSLLNGGLGRTADCLLTYVGVFGLASMIETALRVLRKWRSKTFEGDLA